MSAILLQELCLDIEKIIFNHANINPKYEKEYIEFYKVISLINKKCYQYVRYELLKNFYDFFNTLKKLKIRKNDNIYFATIYGNINVFKYVLNYYNDLYGFTYRNYDDYFVNACQYLLNDFDDKKEFLKYLWNICRNNVSLSRVTIVKHKILHGLIYKNISIKIIDNIIPKEQLFAGYIYENLSFIDKNMIYILNDLEIAKLRFKYSEPFEHEINCIIFKKNPEMIKLLCKYHPKYEQIL